MWAQSGWVPGHCVPRVSQTSSVALHLGPLTLVMVASRRSGGWQVQRPAGLDPDPQSQVLLAFLRRPKMAREGPRVIGSCSRKRIYLLLPHPTSLSPLLAPGSPLRHQESRCHFTWPSSNPGTGCFPAVCPCASHLSFMCLNFLFSEMGIILLYLHYSVHVGFKGVNSYKVVNIESVNDSSISVSLHY